MRSICLSPFDTIPLCRLHMSHYYMQGLRRLTFVASVPMTKPMLLLQARCQTSKKPRRSFRKYLKPSRPNSPTRQHLRYNSKKRTGGPVMAHAVSAPFCLAGRPNVGKMSTKHEQLRAAMPLLTPRSSLTGCGAPFLLEACVQTRETHFPSLRSHGLLLLVPWVRVSFCKASQQPDAKSVNTHHQRRLTAQTRITPPILQPPFP